MMNRMLHQDHAPVKHPITIQKKHKILRKEQKTSLNFMVIATKTQKAKTFQLQQGYSAQHPTHKVIRDISLMMNETVMLFLFKTILGQMEYPMSIFRNEVNKIFSIP